MVYDASLADHDVLGHVQHSWPFSRPAKRKFPAAWHAAVQDSAVVPPGMLTPTPSVLSAGVSLQTKIVNVFQQQLTWSISSRKTAFVSPQSLSSMDTLHDHRGWLIALEDIDSDRSTT